jgi:phosphatidylserine/phosphatidylglycerophosphate/cardiolipin synthase-like enzyme
MKHYFATLSLTTCCALLISAQDISQAAPDISYPNASTSNSSTEVGFGPEGGAEALVVKSINSAKVSIRLAAFAFSSPVIVHALVAAKQRGVDIQIVVDQKHNVEDDEKRVGRNALNSMVGANISVRTNSDYRLHHDKFIIVDARHVQTGSFNYASSANRNSENVLVVWNDPVLAAKYLAHWESRFRRSAEYSQK